MPAQHIESTQSLLTEWKQCVVANSFGRQTLPPLTLGTSICSQEHLFAVMLKPRTQLLLTETCASTLQRFWLVLCFSIQSMHSSLQRGWWEPTALVFLKWHLLLPKIKAQLDRQRQRKKHSSDHCGKQNGKDRGRQRKKHLVGSSSCSFKSAGCKAYLGSCWCLDFLSTDFELCSVEFPFMRTIQCHPIGMNVHVSFWTTVANSHWAPLQCSEEHKDKGLCCQICSVVLIF